MPYNYFCKNKLDNPGCTLCNNGPNIVLEKEDHPYKCESDNKTKLKCIGVALLNIKVGEKMSTQQIQAERKKRASNHFRNEVLPTIPASTDEGKHFRKKYSKTKK